MRVESLIFSLLVLSASAHAQEPASVEVPGIRGTGPVPLMQPPPAVNSMQDARAAGLRPLIIPPTVPFADCASSAEYRSAAFQRWLFLSAGLVAGFILGLGLGRRKQASAPTPEGNSDITAAG